ncbi:MAG: hypothetical protein NTY19_42065 [Planctomycetota bacterium]|nr:hypothetical protein [Planctomycetota bacterium]
MARRQCDPHVTVDELAVRIAASLVAWTGPAWLTVRRFCNRNGLH